MTTPLAPILVLAGAAVALPAQPQTPPAFDVASVKLNFSPPGGRRGPEGGMVRIAPGSVTGRRATVSKLIQTAYRISTYQIAGAPAWVSSDEFDIEAKAETADKNQLRQVLQTLLADRFQLAFHRVTREMPVYVMTVGKNGLGPNLHPMKDGGTVPQIRDAKPAWGSSADREGPTVIFPGDTMDSFALIFSGPNYNFDRPVVNKTGVEGVFYGYLHWGVDDDPVRSIQEQLGLRFESQKAPMEALIIDRIEKPTANEP